jgi:uncharacterized membrane protein YeaQ/YmgE (transglycosylase-associated protein family)
LIGAIRKGKGEIIMNILIWIVSGIIAGWLAGLVVKGRGFGLVGDLVIGLLGGVVGGWLAGYVGLQPVNWLGNILVAAFGGVVLVVVIRALRRV